MDVREKLVEIIQNSVGGCARHWAEVIADGLIAHGVTVQEWIPVTERLPDKSGYFMFYCADSPYRGFVNGIGVSFYQHKAKNWKATNNAYVTHWMPLPQPPKGE